MDPSSRSQLPLDQRTGDLPVVPNGHNGVLSIASLLQTAVERLGGEGTAAVVEALEKLVALHERIEERRAAGEFAAAMAEFQGECPPIPKTATAKVSKAGVFQYSYDYAELDQIAKIVNPRLRDLGMSYSWDEKTEADKIQCTCTLRHKNGHSVTSTFSCPTDTKADMTGAQRNGAALTYAKRQSLIQVLGLTTCDPDTDGAPANIETITDDQVRNLESLISEVGADLTRFLVYMKAPSLDAILASDYKRAVSDLERKRRTA